MMSAVENVSLVMNCRPQFNEILRKKVKGQKP